MLTDTHSHIHFKTEFPDVDDVIDRAEANGIRRQILIGCGISDCFNLPAFIGKYSQKDFWCAVGIHPHDSNKVNGNLLKDLAALCQKEEKIIAVGEIGLDYFKNYQPKEIQQRAFLMQLDLARQLDLPVVVHVRDAWEDTFEILKNAGARKVILHTFCGDVELARKCWNLGYYTSFSGVITYPKNEYLRDLIAQAPEDLILLETDCPYLPPQRYRGQRNEPAFMLETALEVARLRNVDLEDIADITTQNASAAFLIKN